MSATVRALVAAMLLVASIAGVGMLVPDPHVPTLHAIVLAFIAAVYVGFSLTDTGHQRSVESVAAGCFAVAGLLGVISAVWWVVAGLTLHAAWDLLHHPGWKGRPLRTVVPTWYIPFCVVVDLLLAVLVAVSSS